MSTVKLKQFAPVSEQPGHDRLEVTLLARGIPDEVWVAAFERSTDDLMRRFSQYGSGSDYELIRKAIVADLDRQAFLETIGREFTARLVREIGRGADIDLGLQYLRMDLSKVGAMRFVSFTIEATDAAAIYDWNVTRAAPGLEIPAIGSLSRWDWGLWLDSMVRSLNQADRNGASFYGGLFLQMWNDGFIVKAMLLALRHPDVFSRQLGMQDCTLH